MLPLIPFTWMLERVMHFLASSGSQNGTMQVEHPESSIAMSDSESDSDEQGQRYKSLLEVE